jgi:hypothetical protein
MQAVAHSGLPQPHAPVSMTRDDTSKYMTRCVASGTFPIFRFELFEARPYAEHLDSAKTVGIGGGPVS